MDCIVYSIDGRVCVAYPVERSLEDVLANDIPVEAQGTRVVDVSEIPKDRYFRNAWGADLKIDMPLAREIHKNILRVERDNKLKLLDVKYTKADEQGDVVQKSAVAVQRQALRDMPADPAFAAATTPEELKLVRPVILDQVN